METLPDGAEAVALAQLMRDEFPQLPFWLSFQCRDGEHLGSGERLAEVATAVLGEAAPHLIGLGVNCVAPEYVESLLTVLAAALDAAGRGPASARPLELLCYANSGEPWDAVTRTWQPLPQEYVETTGPTSRPRLTLPHSQGPAGAAGGLRAVLAPRRRHDYWRLLPHGAGPDCHAGRRPWPGVVRLRTLTSPPSH